LDSLILKAKNLWRKKWPKEPNMLKASKATKRKAKETKRF
jgi:hypothetical protein